MDKLDPPVSLSFEGNVSQNWKNFKRAFNIYLIATKYHKEADDVQCALFLHVAGKDAVDKYNTFTFNSEEDRQKLQTILIKFDDYCTPRRNLTVERHNFFMRNQLEGESVDQWVTDLKLKSASCEFADLRDSLIKDRIVCGILDLRVKTRLLEVKDLSLERAITLCQSAERSKQEIQALGLGHEIKELATGIGLATVDEVKKARWRKTPSKAQVNPKPNEGVCFP